MSGFYAGNKMRGGWLQVLSARANADLTPTGTLTDVPGCSFTATVLGAHAFAHIIGVGCFAVAVTEASHTLAVQLVVGTTVQTEQILWSSATAATFATVTQQWVVPLAAGPNFIGLQGRNDGTSNSNRLIKGTFTTLVATVYDVP